MPQRGFWWAAALVVASNIGAWGLAALNRTGEPEAVLVLTERELRLPDREADNTALWLELVFDRPGAAGQPRLPAEAGWFDRDRLATIGFDCSRAVTAEHESFYRRQPPRATYAALEYEGEAWRRLQEAMTVLRGPQAPGGPGQDVTAAPEPGGTPGDPQLESHLLVIDVDNDPAVLRARHPDRRRVVIAEATAVLRFVNHPGKTPFLVGRVTAVHPGHINVPREWRRHLEGLRAERRRDAPPPALREPRFKATVQWGRRLEPWVTDVQLLPAAPAR
jgi:hypothetical protein